MSISAEEKNHYLREAAIVLAREGFHTDRTHAGGLRVLLDGAPLCEVTENGGITYRNEDIDEPERIDAKDKVYEIVRTTAEYMRQMETAPFLKADGLEDGYKVLADFNDIVLAGIQSKYGVQFVTWDWSFDRKGVSHGHYYTGLYSSGNYEAAKRDFATRSGLIPEQQLFREKQLIEIYDRGDAWIYCDPPYFEAECYEVAFPKENHQRLHDTLLNSQGYVMVSYNYCPYICELYQEFYIFRVVRPNSMSQTAGSEYEEVIITNYDPRKACWQLSLESLLNCGSEARYDLIHEPERPIKMTN